MIADECTVPKGSDDGLISKMKKQFLSSKPNKFFLKGKKPRTFVVRHFADGVDYDFRGCLATNQDKTPLIFTDVMKSSSSGRSLSQLLAPMKAMNATHPHYIRWLKPSV